MLFLKACFGLLSLLLFVPTLASELSDKLQAPHYLLLMRHAYAPGVGDPQQFQLGDCQTQRNLNSQGRLQASNIGNWLKNQGVTQAQVYSSPWCRCLETAQLLNFSKVQTHSALSSFFNEMHKEQQTKLELEKLMAEKIKTKQKNALIFVTHHVNIFALTGQNVDSADLVLVKLDINGKVVSHQVIAKPE